MKNKGLTFIEIIIAMTLFSISLLPLIKYLQFSFSTNRRYLNLEKSFYIFEAIERQLLAQDYKSLESSLGKREYNFKNFGKDNLTQNFFIPYQIDKNSNLKLEISKIYYQYETEKYEYLEINFMYIDSNKSFKSKNLVKIW